MTALVGIAWLVGCTVLAFTFICASEFVGWMFRGAWILISGLAEWLIQRKGGHY